MFLERSEIADSDKWNVEALYPKLEIWENDFHELLQESEKKWPSLTSYRGNLGRGPAELKSALEALFHEERLLNKLYTYAHLKHDEDVAHEKHKQAYDRISLLYHDFSSACAWIEPELMALHEETMHKYLKSEELKPYHIYLQKIARLKSHTLSSNEEELLALANNALETSYKAFGAFSNADLKFDPAIDSDEKKHELTQGKYTLYLQSKDRVLRETAFRNLHAGFLNFENTLCELLSGQVQTHVFHAKAKKYSSCLEAALFPHQIDTSVYLSLIKAVHNHLGVLHDYISLRKKLLNVKELHTYDLYVSLASDIEMKFTFDEAIDILLKSITPLGETYRNDLEKGIKEQRWVDRYENKRKRSGAYSSGCYDSFPYILMNFQGTLRDLATLSHEAGHSMHSLLSRRHQPYHYSGYSIFVAEVASIFHEELLFRYLLDQAKTKKERFYLINQKLDDIRATLFRQVQFAEFELKLHQMAEDKIPLTAGILKQLYLDLNRDYYGKDLTLDDELAGEFLRVPHFYYNFYVYQYATGISAAYSLAERVLNEGEEARKAYLQFLSSGGSKYPIELLINAGIDMRNPLPVEKLIAYFENLKNLLAENA